MLLNLLMYYFIINFYVLNNHIGVPTMAWNVNNLTAAAHGHCEGTGLIPSTVD